MTPLVLIPLAAVGLLLATQIREHHASITLQAGHSYRFTTEVRPALDLAGERGLASMLAASGATEIEANDADGATRVTYLLRATRTTELELGTALLAVGPYSLTVRDVREVR